MMYSYYCMIFIRTTIYFWHAKRIFLINKHTALHSYRGALFIYIHNLIACKIMRIYSKGRSLDASALHMHINIYPTCAGLVMWADTPIFGECSIISSTYTVVLLLHIVDYIDPGTDIYTHTHTAHIPVDTRTRENLIKSYPLPDRIHLPIYKLTARTPNLIHWSTVDWLLLFQPI